MPVIVLLVLLVVIAWIIASLHAEGMESLARQKRQERASACYLRPTYRVIDIERHA